MNTGTGIQLVVVAVAATALSCTGRAEAPSASPDAPAAPTTTTPAPPARVETRATISSVAGRVDDRKKQRVKDVVERVVDGYLDGGFVAGPYPRGDFSAALADFRAGAATDATTALDELTNHDIGAGVAGVTATHRRLRIDVLAPQGRPSAATARFVLRMDVEPAVDLSTPARSPTPTPAPAATPVAVPSTRKVVGSLFLTNQDGAWSVFGYVVRKVDQ